MLSFLKKAKKKGQDTTIASNELLNGEMEQTGAKAKKQKLHFHESWYDVNQEQKYIYQFLHKELPSLQENQLSLAGIDARTQDDTHYITTFIRSSVTRAIQLEHVTLLLLNSDKEVCARKRFDLSTVGEIQAHTNMPWIFTFEKDTWTEATLSSSDWQVAFELHREHQLELSPEWEEQLPEEQKQKLHDIVAGLKPLGEGEINFHGLQASRQENNDLHITLLIRNGALKDIAISQLPLHIIDASNDVVANGSFTLADFEVKSNTSKPWTFIFPASLVVKDEMDLSKWRAVVPQQQ